MINSKSNINVKIDSDVKQGAVQIFELMGLDQTTAIDMFYRRVILDRGLPFQPAAAEKYGQQVLDLIKKKNIPHKTVEVNEKGHIIADKTKDPELYDWAVNG
ncbi:MAG: type II toxin-antitoxin system RelB/DinJ family antitoxin [Oscillospiraceae bacterium]|nr:type II toxin-antitoxin system RelB/DinJ family antitoxin [Oscillospiraceae bacterium]